MYSKYYFFPRLRLKISQIQIVAYGISVFADSVEEILQSPYKISVIVLHCNIESKNFFHVYY